MSSEFPLCGFCDERHPPDLCPLSARIVAHQAVREYFERADRCPCVEPSPDGRGNCRECLGRTFQPVMPLPTTDAERQAALYAKIHRLLAEAESLLLVAMGEAARAAGKVARLRGVMRRLRAESRGTRMPAFVFPENYRDWLKRDNAETRRLCGE